jgi:flagellar biosynthesis anti-sigma factor FlgM
MGKMDIRRMSGTEAARTDFQRDVRTPSADAEMSVGARPPVTEDKLEISSRAAEVGKLVGDIKVMGDVRAERVEALSGEVAAGTYNPDGEQIASSMISGQ